MLRQLKRRPGELSPAVADQIRGLPLEQLEGLGDALLDFSQMADLVAWLTHSTPSDF